MDEQQEAFVETFRQFLEGINRQRRMSRLTPLGEIVQAHLGVEVLDLPAVSENVPSHRLVDVDLALSELAATDPHARLLGVSGAQMAGLDSISELLMNPHFPFEPGPVDYVEAATGPQSQHQVVALGLRLFQFEQAPVVVLQVAARPNHGQEHAQLNVLAADPAAAGRLLGEVRRLMEAGSVLRGQVISFGRRDDDSRATGTVFVERPTIAETDVVLPDGVLDRIVAHVVGIGKHRDALREAGRHLKRGVLLYGPTGTGKTHTVRHPPHLAHRGHHGGAAHRAGDRLHCRGHRAGPRSAACSGRARRHRSDRPGP